MVTEATPVDLERLKKVSEGEVSNIKEYIILLEGIVETLEEDIFQTRSKAKEFLKSGQKQNYGHLMERVKETIERIETCHKCIEECKIDLERKEKRLKEYNQLLFGK